MEDVSVIKKAAEMNAEHLLAHFDRIADAPDAIPRLRRFILDLAVRGKLVPQDPNDEPASELLKRIAVGKGTVGEGGGESGIPNRFGSRIMRACRFFSSELGMGDSRR